MAKKQYQTKYTREKSTKGSYVFIIKSGEKYKKVTLRVNYKSRELMNSDARRALLKFNKVNKTNWQVIRVSHYQHGETELEIRKRGTGMRFASVGINDAVKIQEAFFDRVGAEAEKEILTRFNSAEVYNDWFPEKTTSSEILNEQLGKLIENHGRNTSN